MCSKLALAYVIAGMTLLFVNATRADVPAPPVNQVIGMRDVLPGNLTELECRACHSSGVPNRHHLLYGKRIPAGSHVPYPDGNGDGVADTTYSCVSCHGQSFAVVRNCVVCHTGNAHHATAKATSGDCKACHGSVVDNMNDGHYVPSYAPSLVTPSTSRGYGLPVNSRGNGAGACDYCHDHDDSATPPIGSMSDLHHDGRFHCTWCHDITFTEPAIRVCERCHGPDSLHNIQADSPAPGNYGTVVVGGELAGYGHVGRDGGPGDSDCWGCHGFAMAFAPGSGPVIPTVYGADRAVTTAGKDTMVILTGASLTSTIGDTLYEADIRLTAANGSSVTLTPDVVVNEGMLAVTIPGKTPPGNYVLRASKAGFTSSAAAISIVPKVKISRAVSKQRTVTMTGTGFGGYAPRSGTAVTGRTAAGKTVKGAIVSWRDGKIVARFGSLPSKVTVNSVFGKAAAKVATP